MPECDSKGSFVRQSVLVIANSGRMLAQALRHANYLPLVIDLFADQDTELIAEQLWQVEDLSLEVVQGVIDSILLSYNVEGVVYGSGLENHLATLGYLSERFNVIGNDITVVKQVCSTKAFFAQLDTLGIRHPDVLFHPPEDNAGWLIKPVYHAGGLGISYCKRKAGEHEYYQRFCKGMVGSVLFCVSGEQFSLIAYHRQWTVSQDNFTFAGIMHENFLPAIEQQRIQGWLEMLVSYYHLKGLASLDFIWDGRSCYFLEINLRPPASMMLYPELELLNAHMTGQLTDITPDNTVRAMQIVYAKQECNIKRGVIWPEWSFDRPKKNTQIRIGAPICSIMAHEKTAQQTLDSLRRRHIFIENNLY